MIFFGRKNRKKKRDGENPKRFKRSAFHIGVNIFVAFFEVLIVLVLLAVGFMQTSTFREMLRKELVEKINESINGNFYLEEIDGTILTSVELKNFGITLDGDTLFSAERFKSEIGILPLLGKKILVKELSLEKPKIEILEKEKGKWNIERLAKSDKGESGIENESPGDESLKFPFTIELAGLKITDAEFIYRDYLHLDSDSVYRFANYDDIRLRNFNMELNAVADISNNDYYVRIKTLSFKDNLKFFELKKLSALIHVNEKFTDLKNLSVETDSSQFSVSARMEGFSPFGKLKFAANLPAAANLNAGKFCFSDLNTFLPSLEFLHGNVSAALSASGMFGNLSVKNLDLKLGQTNLNLTGSLLNLHETSKLFIKAKIGGNIVYDEVEKLLAGLALPDYTGLTLNDVTVNYEGEPLKFNAEIKAKLDTSDIYAKAFMDLTREPVVYDYELQTANADFSPVIGEKTDLTLTARIKGESFSPAIMKNEINLSVENSFAFGSKISKLQFSSKSNKGEHALALSGAINGGQIDARGTYNLTNGSDAFDFRGRFAGMDLSKFLNDTTYVSNLNFEFAFTAENIGSNKIQSDLEIAFDSAVFRGSDDLSRKKISLAVWGDSLSRHIDLKSSLVDAEISGTFNYENLPLLAATQIDRISEIIDENIVRKVFSGGGEKQAAPVSRENVDLRYNIIFNSTDFWAKILDVNALTIAGYSFGGIQNNKREFRFKNTSYFSNFIYIDGDEVYYLDNVNLKTDVKNSNETNSIDSLRISLGLQSERILAGAEFSNSKVNVLLDGKDVFVTTNSIVDSSFGFLTSANLSVEENLEKAVFDRLEIYSNNVVWKNKNPINVSLANGKVYFDNFILTNDSSRAVLHGDFAIDKNAESDLTLKLENLSLSGLEKMFTGGSLGFEGQINLTASLTGKTNSPTMISEFTCTRFKYGGAYLGDVFFDGSYKNSRSEIKLKMLSGKMLKRNVSFSLLGSVNKSLFGESDNENELDLRFTANDFNLSAFSVISDDIKNVNGKLNADISISGKLDNPRYDGYAKLTDGKLYVTANGLDYLLGGEFAFNDRLLTIDKFYLKNDPATGFDGEIDLGGKISLDKENFGILNLELHGGLGLLSEKTKFVNPYFYGNLFVRTGDKWKFSYVNDKAFLEGKLKIVDANITISSSSGGETVDISDIDYIYAVDSSMITENEAQKLLEKYIEAQLKAAGEKRSADAESFFNYNLTFDIVNRATLNFVFSKVANQKLKAIIDGSIRVSSIDNESVVQGEFRLLPGSRLDFFRSFDASGTIRFERELLNPYLDITAVYKGVHYKSMQAQGVAEEDVAVKIKLQGLLKDLGENFTAKKSNISVYVGKKNIDNNIPDPKLNASDAMTFILLGKFNNDLTSSEQYKFSNELTYTTTALLGTVMGVFLNSAMGDLINDVDISQTQTRTKVMLKGRLGRFYYSIGGSQEVFQDIAQANWKVEYFFNKNLSFRIERREPLTGYLSNTQMTDEVGIKYKVSF